jgi:cytochrome c oxidase subunit 4
MHDPHGGPREGADVHVGPSVTHGHPGPKEYVVVAVILAVITAIEVAIYYVPEYVPGFKPLLAPTLLILSALKFTAVVGWFMHLKFDSRLFTSLFVGGLILAGSLMIALLALFNHLFV